MVRWSRLLWLGIAWDLIPRIGEKNGTKRSLHVDGRGIPLSLVVEAANVNDLNLLIPTLNCQVIKRPDPGIKQYLQHLCLDRGYISKATPVIVKERGYCLHIPPKDKEQKLPKKRTGKNRRWVVERTASWLNRFRKLLVRYEKKADNFDALLHLACALICFRQVIIIYG